MLPELLTIDEFCKLTSTGKTKVNEEIYAGRLKAVRYGRCIRISRDSMHEWINALPEYLPEPA